MSKENTIDLILSKDILNLIFSFLGDPEDLKVCTQVCKFWSSHATNARNNLKSKITEQAKNYFKSGEFQIHLLPDIKKQKIYFYFKNNKQGVTYNALSFNSDFNKYLKPISKFSKFNLKYENSINFPQNFQSDALSINLKHTKNSFLTSNEIQEFKKFMQSININFARGEDDKLLQHMLEIYKAQKFSYQTNIIYPTNIGARQLLGVLLASMIKNVGLTDNEIKKLTNIPYICSDEKKNYVQIYFKNYFYAQALTNVLAEKYKDITFYETDYENPKFGKYAGSEVKIIFKFY